MPSGDLSQKRAYGDSRMEASNVGHLRVNMKTGARQYLVTHHNPTFIMTSLCDFSK